MKKAITVALLAGITLAGCSPISGGMKQQNVNKSVATVLDLKKKYGSQDDNAIMPMYNVPANKVFTFTFNSNLTKKDDILASDVISVHTDIKAEKESQILSFVDYKNLMADKSTITVSPVTGVLTTDKDLGGGSTWGNAPIYYLRINYDLKASKPTKLKKPIIVPFTIKSEVQVPNLRYQISSDGRLKLLWDKVDGAEKYNIYNASVIDLEKTSNIAPSGAEKGYMGVIPLQVASTANTEFDDFMNDGNHAEATTDKNIITGQNFMVKGEFYVTAVKGNKESIFSPAVDTVKLSSQLPQELADDIAFKTYPDYNAMPKTVNVKMIDGSISNRRVNYDVKNVKIDQYDATQVYYSVEGTALTGYIEVQKITSGDLKSLASEEKSGQSTGLVQADNKTSYIPSPDVPTVIDKKDGTQKDTVAAEEAATNKNVSEGNKEKIPESEIASQIKINADSALEEYLARNLINAENTISLKAFPEAQNYETLTDALLKVIYQNPMILGVKEYKYDYGNLSLQIQYDDSASTIKKKQEEIVKEAGKIESSIMKPGMSNEQKELAIYNYLNDHTKYDNAALKDAEKNNYKGVDEKYNDSFTAYGIMVKKVGVCQSYAETFKMLSDLSNINAIVVTGTIDNVPHAWNKVKVGNDWLNVDATNNETNTGIKYMLYNANDATAKANLFETNKAYWLDNELAKFAGKINTDDYYVKNKLEVTDIYNFETKVALGLEAREKTIVIRVAAKIDESQLMMAAADAFKHVAPDKLSGAQMGSLGEYIVVKTN